MEGSMRSALVGLICLVLGVLGALGYSHYLGEGRDLAALRDQLAKAQSDLASSADTGKQAKSENEAMTAQIEQLNTTKDELKKQLEQAKDAAPTTAPVAPASPFAGPAMANIIKAHLAQQHAERMQMLKRRLHLTPEQEAAVQAAMDEEGKQAGEMATKFMSGGKIDPKSVADLKGMKSVDQTLNDILSPDQKTAYTQMKADQKSSAAETTASFEMNQMAPLLQLSETQKDQVSTALYQVQLDTQDPNWIKNNAAVTAGNPTAILDAQAKAKEDALAKILTPDQLAQYHQQAQAQLDLQRSMMQKFMPQAANPPATSAAAPAPAPPAAP